MRTLGLIGGMSFESTAVYYRLLNEAVRRRLGGNHSASLILYSVDFEPVVAWQRAGQWCQAADHLAGIAKKLEAAGADCILLCTNTMHLVADPVAAAVEIPLLHIIDETAHALARAGCRRPLLLATRYTMEHGFYTDRMAAHGIDVQVPGATDRAETHRIIFDELCAGTVLDRSRATLVAIIEKAKDEGADAVIFGCTEIGLILDPAALPLPGFDTAVVHCEAAVNFALPS